jgi:hypothetical protein
MIVDVLEASGASDGAASSRRRKEIPLDVEPLGAILLHEAGVGDCFFR